MKNILISILCLASFGILKANKNDKVRLDSITEGKRTVGILIFKNAEVLDFAGPFEVFSVSNQIHNNELFEVSVVAKTKEPIIAMNGLSVNPDYSFKDAPDFDVLIISGGMGASLVAQDDEALNWVAKMVEKSELTMSVCTGAAILGKIGKLDDKPYCTHNTVYPFIEKMVPSAKPQKNKRFIQSDEKIFTSAGISAGIDLSFHIVEKFYGKEVAKNTANYMEYKGYE
ncbi:DJ-1/PfpI family protein [Croceitalea rosinachiae]|uniref:DJ-1/PfpI family protein n=1 Tax=Croceitalea rosinachiae TaxID=3075596 RepID=A0ABU3AE56_9FLAO|nr:DJ-1/PfpI family protein [Croceitalea sp. F388]MDT0608471.1 DJ-1/PfpI family protein [Croceitalea sp. F388]